MSKQLSTPTEPAPQAPQAAPSTKGSPRPAARRAAPVHMQPASGQVLSRRRPAHDDMRKWPFSLVFSDNWELGSVDGSLYLLPDFETIRDMPGANNVQQRRTGNRPDTALRDGQLLTEGRIVIPRKEYLVSVEVESDQDHPAETYYYTAFEDVYEHGNGLVRVALNTDAWNKWRLGLVRKGTIPPPEEYVLERAMQSRQSSRQRALSHPESGHAWREKAERLAKEIEALPAAFARTVEAP